MYVIVCIMFVAIISYNTVTVRCKVYKGDRTMSPF